MGYVVDFITKAVPRYQVGKKWAKSRTFPDIKVQANGKFSQTDHATMDRYYTSTHGQGGFLNNWNKQQVQDNTYKRIRAIAYVAWINGYENLVLGPAGCGAFSNDPRVMAKVFDDVFRKEFKGCFKTVHLAYLIFGPKDFFGYKMFQKKFTHSYKVEPWS